MEPVDRNGFLQEVNTGCQPVMSSDHRLTRVVSTIKTEIYDRLPAGVSRRRFGTADILKCGYPKSGNNWVHFLIANTIVRAAGREDDVHFQNNDLWLPTDRPGEPPVDGFPRLLSNTDPLDEQRHIGPDTKVLYIVRHPGDVMESFYHYRKYRWNDDVGTFSEFIRSDRWGIPAWTRHVRSWEGNWDVLVQFERLKEDPLRELCRIVTLFDRDFEESTLEYAVKQSSFENMRRMEEKYGIRERRGANPEYTFMRKGESDRGEAYFDEDNYRYLQRAGGEVMELFGYDVPV